MAKTTVELPDGLHRTLRVKAALDDRSMNDIIIEALQTHLSGFRIEPGMLEIEEVSRDPERSRQHAGRAHSSD
ncbi:MAG TPA: Arc family DNA-binding protein [Chloroflexota bacterium]|nr:Arc family DNA-binding protein [Chloroflexota bacterium]